MRIFQLVTVVAVLAFICVTVSHHGKPPFADEVHAWIYQPDSDPNTEYVTRYEVIYGPVVTNTILTNRLACDQIQVNGYDPLKLDDAILNALTSKGIFTPADIQAIIAKGKVERPLRAKP